MTPLSLNLYVCILSVNMYIGKFSFPIVSDAQEVHIYLVYTSGIPPPSEKHRSKIISQIYGNTVYFELCSFSLELLFVLILHFNF